MALRSVAGALATGHLWVLIYERESSLAKGKSKWSQHPPHQVQQLLKKQAGQCTISETLVSVYTMKIWSSIKFQASKEKEQRNL